MGPDKIRVLSWRMAKSSDFFVWADEKQTNQRTTNDGQFAGYLV